MKTKISIIFLLALFLSIEIVAQSAYYYHKNEKIYIHLDTKRLSVNSTSASNYLGNLEKDVLKKTQQVEDKTKTNLIVKEKTNRLINQYSQSFYSEIELKEAISSNPTNYLNFIKILNNNPDVIKVTPCFQTKEGQQLGLSNLFYVKLNNITDENILLEYALQNNVEVLGSVPLMPLWYVMACNKTNPKNALENANMFYESNLFKTAEPAFSYHDLQSSTDAFFAQQWGIKNTGQYGTTYVGIDVNAENAWPTTKGAGVKVAVYDHGFEMTHPDLAANVYGTGFDAQNGTSPSIVRGDHGTACAGIIGAVQNDSGITGVAPEAKLVSISLNLISNNTPLQIASGFNWARTNGIDVISNSWGGYAPSSIISDAIWDALTLGRAGKGCIIVFAAGNANNTNVQYPGSYFPEILVVGAMSPCGERKNPTSCDGEDFWGSCYGPLTDVVAPGVKIYTTDNENNGGSGYFGYTSGQSYTSAFGGTSAACPHVAGVAALVLSANPNLTRQKVVDIIEKSTKKVRSDLYSYATTSGRPNGTWNNEMGYGLVDAAAAVLFAQAATTDALVNISGKNRFCSGIPVTFTATPINGGTAPVYQWKVNGVNVGTNAPTFTTSTLTNGQIVTCVMTSNKPGVTGNPALSNAITISITAFPSVSIALNTPSCPGVPLTFIATPVNAETNPTYQWKKNGVNIGTNSPTFTSSSLITGQVISCVMTSNTVCSTPVSITSNAITINHITSISLPTISIAITSGSNPSELGAYVEFTATVTNPGSNPYYQWKINGVNAGPASPVYKTAILTNGQKVTCEITTQPFCSNTTSTALSNAITMSMFPSPYCAAGTNPSYSTIPYTNGITKVSIGTIQNSSDYSSYSNYSDQITDIVEDAVYPLEIKTYTANQPCKVLVWCDWNDNKVFTDSGEKVYESNVFSGPDGIVTTNIIVPAGTSAGLKRMRIRFTRTTTLPNLKSCGNSGYGEVEDYTLNVETYCKAGTTSTNYEYISNVNVGSINNSSGSSSYSNYSSQSTNLAVGVGATIKVTMSAQFIFSDKLLIWCDWNNNAVFTDPGEAVFVSAPSPGPFVTTIIPPAGTPLGKKRMRIRLTDPNNLPNYTPCGNSKYGEVEDYTINVVASGPMVAIALQDENNNPNQTEQPLNDEAIKPQENSYLNKEQLSIYPNPNNGMFTIKGKSRGDYILTDQTGKKIISFKLSENNDYSIIINELNEGFYIVSGQSETGISNQKIVVTK